MIRLRPYKPSDAWELLKWWDGRTEEEFVKWSAGAFTYPLTIEQLDAYFETWCLKEGGGWPVMALDASGKPVGLVYVALGSRRPYPWLLGGWEWSGCS